MKSNLTNVLFRCNIVVYIRNDDLCTSFFYAENEIQYGGTLKINIIINIHRFSV